MYLLIPVPVVSEYSSETFPHNFDFLLRLHATLPENAAKKAQTKNNNKNKKKTKTRTTFTTQLNFANLLVLAHF